MKRRHAAAVAVAVAGSSSAALGASLVTENFSSNTNLYWNRPDTTTAPQNYQWSNTDNTGNSVNPPGGTASGAGEMGGVLTRSSSPANFYGFNVGTISYAEAFEARGVIRLVSAGSSSGFFLGYFAGLSSYGSGGSPSNFVGLHFDDGDDVWVNIFDEFQNRDRSDVASDLVAGQTIPFSMAWAPPPAGSSNKGTLTVNINGAGNYVHNYSGNLNFNDFTHFGVMPVSADGGPVTVYFDDFTFSSENPIGPATGWAVDGDGDYHVSGNWVGGVPNAVGAAATFGGVISADRLVYANSPVTVGTLKFNNASTYLLTGVSTLSLQVSSGSALIDVQQGSHKINLPLTVASNTTVNVASGATLRISDPVTVNSSRSVTQSGGGSVIYESTVTVQSGGSIELVGLQHLPSLTVASTGGATLRASGGNTSMRVNALSLTGKLDLKDNKLVTVAAIGTYNGSSYTGVSGMVATGRNGGVWNAASGITTSMPDATGGTGYTMLGVATGAQVKGIAAAATDIWGGRTIVGSDTLVMYTYGGDANLSGNVDVDDYGQIDFNASTGSTLKGWFNGDFDYSGTQDVDDYGIIDFVVNIQGAPFPTGDGAGLTLASVPEPAFIAVGVLPLIVSGRRRRGCPRD